MSSFEISWTPPSAEELQPLIAGYEVIELLGRGGMGAVYKARQKSLDRLIAIKILPPPPEEDPFHATKRFEHEARAMARLAHPGVVGVHDFGQTVDERYFYFVMEYIDGSDLAQVIAGSGYLSPEDSIAIVSEVCQALAYAHQHGVIHRDIKPSNILLDGEGRVKMADFGLAHVADPTQSRQVTLTRENLAMGTPDYAAPELMSSQESVDERADLYSVGVMLYQMLTGEVPRGLFKMPSEKRAELDGRFDEIICMAMEPEPDKRYQTALEVRRDLGEIASVPPFLLEESSPSILLQPGLGRRLAAAVVVLMLVVAGVLLVSLRRPNGENAESKVPNPGLAPPVENGKPPPPHGEGWVDLLAQVDVEADSLHRAWRWEDGILRTPAQNTSHEAIELSLEDVPYDYDLSVHLTRNSGLPVIMFAVKRADGRGGWIMFDGWSAAGQKFTTEIGLIDGQSQEKTMRKERFLEPGTLHHVLLRVRNDSFTALLDGEVVERWEGEWSRIEQTEPHFLPDSATGGEPVMALCACATDVTFHRVDLRPLDQVVDVNQLVENEGNIAGLARLSSNDDSFSTRYPIAGVTDGRVSDGPAGQTGYTEAVHTVFDSFGLANWVCFTDKTNEVVLEFATPVDLRELATYVTSPKKGGVLDADRAATAVSFWVETVNDGGKPRLVKTVLPEDTDEVGGFDRVSCEGPWEGVFKLIYSYTPVSNDYGNEVRVAEVLALEAIKDE